MHAISRPPKAIVAYVFAQYFFSFIGLGPESGGYSGPPWQPGVRAPGDPGFGERLPC